MDTHDRHVLAHIKADGDFIAIRTFSRAIGRRGRFLILWEHLREWLETHPERSFMTAIADTICISGWRAVPAISPSHGCLPVATG